MGKIWPEICDALQFGENFVKPRVCCVVNVYTFNDVINLEKSPV